ncbi:nucleoside triphosphate pyrophosphohydrolase [bacterium]|nr:nucleoside triphosphate pyrophosphohydrolase [bacterium]
MKKLIDIVARLRSPDGCPWDKKQTHASLIPYLLEEVWEVIEEIQQEKTDAPLKEELGDLLLQIVLHAQIAQEQDLFTMDDVVDAISEKMVLRHPHVFQTNDGGLSDKDLKLQWHKIKSNEKNRKSITEGIPVGAPALLNALTISKRAASLGFDWETPGDVLLKVEEELDEVRHEMKTGNADKLEEELGDLLFTITNLARVYNINPELALKKGNDKFIRRFTVVEKEIIKAKKEGTELSMEEMQSCWETTK